MLPDRVSNPGSLTYESGALPIALRGPAAKARIMVSFCIVQGTVPTYSGPMSNVCRDNTA